MPSWEIAWTELHHELLSLQAEAIAAIKKEEAQEGDLQIRRKELQIEQLHVQLQALSTAKGEERLKAMAKCNELNTMEQMDTDQLKIFVEKEVAIADNEATIVRSNNKVDITRSNNERKVKLGTNQGAIFFTYPTVSFAPALSLQSKHEASQNKGQTTALSLSIRSCGLSLM